MKFDLVLCECVCGRRQGYPVPEQHDLTGFVCDNCFLRYPFREGMAPTPVQLTDESGQSYTLGFRVFSVRRSNQELAEELLEAWFSDSETASDDTQLVA